MAAREARVADFPELLSRFARAVAANDGAGFAALFTEDGIYDDGFFGEYKGRKAIVDMLDLLSPSQRSFPSAAPGA